MKKYLIKGLLALFGGIILVGCADHDVDYVPIAQQKTQAYEAAFNEMMDGKTVDSKQDWGFDGLTVAEIQGMAQGRANTRTPEDVVWWDSGDRNYPVEFTREEKMAEILSKLPEGANAANKLNDYEFYTKGPIEFSIVYSVTSAPDQIGYYYYDPSEGIDSRIEKTFVYNIQNYDTGNDNYFFRYGHADGNWLSPITNPNDPNAWTCTKIWNEFGFSKVKAKQFTINFPTERRYRMGFFVINGDLHNGGHKMYSNKSLNADGNFYSAVVTLNDGTYAVGLEDWWQGDFDCNDMVMTFKKTNLPEIINYSESSKQQWKYKLLVSQGRVFCEDLGAAGKRDLDFNDIVFDARIWATQTFDVTTTNGGEPSYSNFSEFSYEADICMLAAGGTIPAKLIFNKTNDTRDVHPMFDPSIGMTTMVNTIDGNAGKLAVDVNSTNPGSKTYYGIDITNIIEPLLEDPKYEITVNDIPISVLWQTSTDETTAKLGTTMGTVGELHAEPGKVPHKFCLPIGTKWPSERRPFDEAYPGFTAWAADSTSNSKFYENFVQTALYSDEGCNDKLPTSDSYGEYAKGSQRWIAVGNAESTQTTETEIFVWENSGVTLAKWEDNYLIYDDIFSRMDENADDYTYTIRIYGTSNKASGWGAQLLTGRNWDNMTVFGAKRDDSKFDEKGYIEYRKITKDLVRVLKYTKDIGCTVDLQGQDFVATQISFVKTVTVKL